MKKNARFYFAMFAAKLANTTQHMLKMNASYFPGKLALKLCPDFFGRVDHPENIIAVTGTNGKTTCCNMALNILEANGYKVLNNRLGSNVDAGVATSLVQGSTLFGKAKYEYALFEVDERSSKRIYSYITPKYILCTNLFRDSIQRNAHTEFIFNFINSNLPKGTHMILNGDDVISGRLAPENPRTYFSVLPMDTDIDACESIVNDMSICPVCHTNLEFSHVRYHHIGYAHCPSCGFKLPEAEYKAAADRSAMTMTVTHDGKEHTYSLVNDSIFNIYNEVAVIALMTEFGLSPEQIAQPISDINVVSTRHSHETYKGMKIVTNLAKSLNPVACSCVFDYVRRDKTTKEVILVLNAAHGTWESSENVTWLFDTDFQFLGGDEIKRIIIGGRRAEDEKLRLLIAGVPEEKITCIYDEKETTKLLKLDCESVYILHDLNFGALGAQLKENVKKMLDEKVGD